jgi:hypothetical protein
LNAPLELRPPSDPGESESAGDPQAPRASHSPQTYSTALCGGVLLEAPMLDEIKCILRAPHLETVHHCTCMGCYMLVWVIVAWVWDHTRCSWVWVLMPHQLCGGSWLRVFIGMGDRGYGCHSYVQVCICVLMGPMHTYLPLLNYQMSPSTRV